MNKTARRKLYEKARNESVFDTLENLLNTIDNGGSITDLSKYVTYHLKLAEQLELARAVVLLQKEARVCRDILSLASKYVTLEQVLAWGPKKRDEAMRWGAGEYAGAAVEEPPYPKRRKPPEHVRVLPDILSIDPSPKPGGPWVTRLRFSDGTEEVLSKFPGD